MSGVLIYETLRGANNSRVEVRSPNKLVGDGRVVQTVVKRSMERFYTQARNPWDVRGGVWKDHIAILEPLEITITPTHPRSCIAINFVVNGETHHDSMYIGMKNRAPYFYNQNYGYISDNNNFVGLAIANNYDRNEDSTPFSQSVWMFDEKPNSIEPITYSLGVYSDGNFGFVLNGTRANYENGGNAYEQVVSQVIAEEWGTNLDLTD